MSATLTEEMSEQAIRAFSPWVEPPMAQIEALYQERPDGAVRRLAVRIRRDLANPRFVVSGARGSGKTTVLNRLAHELRDAFYPITLDINILLPTQSDTFAILTVLGTVLEALYQRELAREGTLVPQGAGVPSEPWSEVLKRVGYVVEKGGALGDAVGSILKLVPGEAGEVGALLQLVSQGARHAGTIFHTLTAARDAERRSSAELQEDNKTLVGAINERLDWLHAHTRKTPVLLMDGIDRRPDLTSLYLAFRDVELFQQIQAPLVLTGPVPLRHLPELRNAGAGLQLFFLDNIAVRDREQAETLREEGVDFLRLVYALRCSTYGLPEDLLDPGLVDQAAIMSAGLVRDFMRFIYDALMEALSLRHTRVEEHHLQTAFKIQRLDLQGRLNRDTIQLLREVLHTRTLPPGDQADTLLLENFIVCYANGDSWFRPHELLVDWLQHRAGGQQP